MTKKLTFLFALILSTLTVSANDIEVIRGDVNGDGKVDMDDATFVTNIILGTETATKAADVDNDGTVNMPDVMFVINFIKNGKFPDESSKTWPKDLDYSQWMQYLEDSRLVADLSLPGAHDAVTAEGWDLGILNPMAEMTAKCQDLTIQQQLEQGVRVFDLRPELITKDDVDVLRCSHGVMTTVLSVTDFFKKLKTYLAAKPTEFCIITAQLSATSSSKMEAWATLFNGIINSEDFKGLFVNFKPRMTVGEMRGHVLLLSQEKYADKPVGGYCEGWTSKLELDEQKKGTIIDADGNKSPLWVQDYWEDITRENKDAALVRMLEAAAGRDMKADAPAWVINFPSAYIDGPFSDNYRKNAASANVVAINWLAQHTGSVGIIYMDFACVDKSMGYDGETEYETAGKKLVDSVIRQNAKQP